jgi:hypothetical protein
MIHIILILIPLLSLSSSIQSDKSEMLSNKWEYVNSHDPYQGGIDYPADPADPDNMKALIFHQNGNFEEIDQWNHWKGKWKLNSDETKIGVCISEHNGTSIQNSGDFDFGRNLLSLTDSELKFWIQGRHGGVTYEYNSIK